MKKAIKLLALVIMAVTPATAWAVQPGCAWEGDGCVGFYGEEAGGTRALVLYSCDGGDSWTRAHTVKSYCSWCACTNV